MRTPTSIDVPEAFAASYGGQGADARAWLAGLPRLGGDLLERWDLRPEGPAGHGVASLVLPVPRADGTPAALKLQQPAASSQQPAASSQQPAASSQQPAPAASCWKGSKPPATRAL
ncbi:hypothetical protein [Streptomyces lydicus]|uniref:hypothetical protein n=1 Tax=Streptomyces lydicus TaxID=47763 RepID=UPI0035BE8DBB